MDAVTPSRVLGIWDGHDAGAAIVADGRLLVAVSEERLCRQKRASGFPYRAIAACLKHAGLDPADVDAVAVPGVFGRLLHRAGDALYRRTDSDRDPLGAASTAVRVLETGIARLPLLRTLEATGSKAVLTRRLADLGLRAPITAVPHHDAHAVTAGLLVGPDAMIVTMDGYGDGLCGTFDALSPDREDLASPEHSVALVYGAITRLLGFGEGDEGKVMGLAASGEPAPLSEWFRAVIGYGRCDPRLGGRRRREELRAHPREDVAEARVEEVVVGWIEARRRGRTTLAVSGGLFANVALNGILARRFDEVRVFPHMGDGGLCVGAAVAVAGLDTLENGAEVPFWGPDHDEDVPAEAARRGLSCARAEEGEVLEAIEAGLIVGRCVGRSEFGPRALGHRSILLRADRPALADLLNERLGRDDFMPFAPIRGRGLGSSTMTVVVEADAELKTKCPAAVHVDGTARTQCVDPVADPELASLLERAEHRGLPALINTSFNRHGEPIVERPSEALARLADGVVDVLVCDGWLVRR